jgi:hypothetical protein
MIYKTLVWDTHILGTPHTEITLGIGDLLTLGIGASQKVAFFQFQWRSGKIRSRIGVYL